MNADRRRLVLASASPRRQELLEQLGLPFSVMVSGVDEEVEDESNPRDLVIQLAERKARAVALTLPDALVIGADTTVVIERQVLNKPLDAADATRMLDLLRGRTHEVWTGVVVLDVESGRIEAGAVRSQVQMRVVPDEVIARYVATGEPLDKAGAYAIQGGAGTFVERIEGCYANVVGLPLCETAILLRRFGVPIESSGPICVLANGDPCPRVGSARQ